MSDIVNRSQIKTYELTVAVTHFMEGTLDDWPAVIQDGVYAALEALAYKEQIPLAIVASRCDTDPDVDKHLPGHFFIHVVASEVVVADERTLAPGTVVRKGLIQ